jgi:hypothetical protein
MLGRRARLVALSSVVVVAVALAAFGGILSAGAASDGQTAATTFKPKQFVGTYSGTWTNTTFGSTGPFSLVIKYSSRTEKMTATLDFGGEVFGCTDPAADKATLRKGKGTNRWNTKGFNVSRTSTGLGKGTLKFKRSTSALTGGGADPSCRTGLKWALDGAKLTKSAITGSVNITLPDGTTAVATLSASKS